MRIIGLFLCLPWFVQSATITANNAITGSWSAGSTWVGGVAPGNGDTVICNSAATINVDTPVIVGISPAAGGTAALTATAGCVINITASLTSRGDTKISGNGTRLNILCPGSFIFDASQAAVPSTALYLLSVGAVDNQTQRIVVTGAASGNAEDCTAITSITTGGAANGRIDSGGFRQGGLMTGSNFKMSNLGDTSHASILFWPADSNNGNNLVTFFLKHVICDSCGPPANNNAAGAGAQVTLDGLSFTNPLGQWESMGVALFGGTNPSAPNGAGGGFYKIINGVYHESLQFQANDMTIENNIFDPKTSVGIWGFLNVTDSPRSFNGNMTVSNTFGQGATAEYSMSNLYTVALSGIVTDPHFLLANVHRSSFIEGQICDYAGTATSGHCIIGGSTPASPITLTVAHQIKLPNGNGGSAGNPSSWLGGDNQTIIHNHNTSHLGSTANESGILYAHIYAGHAGMLRSFRDNLFWDTSARGTKITAEAAAFLQDFVSGTAADYNGGAFNQMLAGNAGKGYDSTFTVTPGAHDVNADPAFVDSSRNIAKWDASLGGPGTMANAVAQLELRNHSTWNKNYTLANLFIYVRAGFVPTTPSIKTGASDGGYMGAVNPVSGSFGFGPATYFGPATVQ